MAFGDWAGASVAGDTMVAAMPYRNSASGTSQRLTVQVCATQVPVDPAKTVVSVTLPDVGYAVGSDVTAMHIFACHLADRAASVRVRAPGPMPTTGLTRHDVRDRGWPNWRTCGASTSARSESAGVNQAAEADESALAIATDLDVAAYTLAALHNVAYTCTLTGQYAHAISLCQQRIKLSQELSDVRGEVGLTSVTQACACDDSLAGRAWVSLGGGM